ncbi:MAG: patatin family protein [Eubacteriales bacterium]|nr:patatin family protein [Eubacteriales bacterium]
MYQAGLILEGGGMRGAYTAGVLDAFLDEQIEFSSIYGVSAGSCHACSYMSKQRGRAFRVTVDYLEDPNYCGPVSFLKTGDMFGAKMLYSQIPNVLDPFDYETFRQYPGKFFAVVTDVDTGEPRYIRVKDLKTQIWAVRASSSLPLISRTLRVRGHGFLDGGVADSIPIRKSMADGNKKNVVILTREKGYQKGENTLMPLMRLRYPHSKAFVKKMEDRHIRYNETLDFLKEEEEKGNVFLIRPQKAPAVGRIEKDKTRLQALYREGLRDGKASVERMKRYLAEEEAPGYSCGAE